MKLRKIISSIVIAVIVSTMTVSASSSVVFDKDFRTSQNIDEFIPSPNAGADLKSPKFTENGMLVSGMSTNFTTYIIDFNKSGMEMNTNKYYLATFEGKVLDENPQNVTMIIQLLGTGANGKDDWQSVNSADGTVVVEDGKGYPVNEDGTFTCAGIIKPEYLSSERYKSIEGVCMWGCYGNNPKEYEVYTMKIEEVDPSDYVLEPLVSIVETEWETGLPSLYEAYKDYFMFGSILEPSILDNAGTIEMYKHHYNVVSAENSMKPESMVNKEKEYTFEKADALVTWALDNSIQVHGHTLVWHNQTQAWLTRDSDGNPLTRAEAKANMEAYITTVAGHYKGKVVTWDVVNEAISGGSNSPWKLAYQNGADTEKGEEGEDYIYDAFVFTRLTDPNAILYYNDFNEHLHSSRQQIYDMVKKNNDRWKEDTRNTDKNRLLIEGIGMQAHYWTGESSSLIDNVTAAIDLYRTLGVKLIVTELDIPAGSVGGPARTATDEEKETQAILYAQLFELYKKNSDIIERVTLWGRNDSSSWRGGNNGDASPLLFDNELKAKPAFWAVLEPEKFLENVGSPDVVVPPTDIPQEPSNPSPSPSVIDTEQVVSDLADEPKSNAYIFIIAFLGILAIGACITVVAVKRRGK